jgi:hypothetical protein
MTTRGSACPHCGYTSRGPRCGACSGAVQALDGRPLPPPRADRLRDLFAGIGEVRGAVTAMLHAREYVGALRVPVVCNLLAFMTIVGGGWLLLAPVFAGVFAEPWPLFDGLRRHAAPFAADVWLLTTWLVLGQPLLDMLAGEAQAGLLGATESRLLRPPPGHGPGDVERHRGLRLRDRARVVAFLLLVWPVALAVALVPWIGLVAVVALGSAIAAVVWFEAPMARRGHTLAARLRLLRAHPWRALGFGFGVQLASAVPFVNLLALAPIATIAATASWLRFVKVRAGS